VFTLGQENETLASAAGLLAASFTTPEILAATMGHEKIRLKIVINKGNNLRLTMA
jgi:hypothetical protein